MIDIISTQHFEAVSTLKDGLILNPHIATAFIAVSEQTGVPVDCLARTNPDKTSWESYAKKLLVYVLHRIMGFSKEEIKALLSTYPGITKHSIESLDKLAVSSSYVRIDQEALTQKLQQYA